MSLNIQITCNVNVKCRYLVSRIHALISRRISDVLHQKMTETCATAHVGGVNIVLLEGITPNIQ